MRWRRGMGDGDADWKTGAVVICAWQQEDWERWPNEWTRWTGSGVDCSWWQAAICTSSASDKGQGRTQARLVGYRGTKVAEEAAESSGGPLMNFGLVLLGD